MSHCEAAAHSIHAKSVPAVKTILSERHKPYYICRLITSQRAIKQKYDQKNAKKPGSFDPGPESQINSCSFQPASVTASDSTSAAVSESEETGAARASSGTVTVTGVSVSRSIANPSLLTVRVT